MNTTTTTKHTPAPWRVGHSGMSVSTDPGDLMAQLKTGKSITIRRICDCQNSTYIGGEEAKANARLIASAPELYTHAKALMGLAGILDKAGILNDPTVRGLFDAVRKAEGQVSK